jgi:electron transfer flavoprotein beta subunit
MKIIVCLKEVVETTVSLGFGQVEPALLEKGRSYRLDPAANPALAVALKLKAQDPQSEIVLLSLGPERVEEYLRDGLALGADRAVRVWEEALADTGIYPQSQILARAVGLLKADLVLTGNRSLDNASGLTGPLMAAWLNVPGLCEVVDIRLENPQSLIATRNISRGLRETVQTQLPAVLSIAASPEKLPYASLDKVLASREAEISCLNLKDLGLSPLDIKDPLYINGLSFPRPRPKAAPLDSSLPAFYRILALLEGGITKRKGEIWQGTPDEIVDRLYDLMVKEEIIKQK